jgi:cytochrome c-type biogenesis protein CcmH/NrfG
MKRITTILTLVLAHVLGAQAADMAPAATVDPLLAQGRGHIAKKDWPAAATTLEAFVKSNPKNADGFNLLGYSYRNLKKYDESFVAYRQALTLDPKHRGAHEYIGIAYVQTGQLDKAREHLASLDKLCPFSCEEYRDLKKAVEQAAKP